MENNLIRRYLWLIRLAERFTLAVLSIGILAGIGWTYFTDMGTGVNVLTAVLIVACPCGLALSAPMALGNALRILIRKGFYAKNVGVLERLAQVTHLVFDKTGTLTQPHQSQISYHGPPLNSDQKRWLRSLTRESIHPVSQRINQSLGLGDTISLSDWASYTGKGIEANIEGHHILLGSVAFLAERTNAESSTLSVKGTYWACDGEIQGYFTLTSPYRPGWSSLVKNLAYD